jgi:hypothetical protein
VPTKVSRQAWVACKHIANIQDMIRGRGGAPGDRVQNAMAGSILVRLRYQGFWLVLGRDPEANRRPPPEEKPVQVRLETRAAPRNIVRPCGRSLLLRADAIVCPAPSESQCGLGSGEIADEGDDDEGDGAAAMTLAARKPKALSNQPLRCGPIRARLDRPSSGAQEGPVPGIPAGPPRTRAP